MSSHVCVCQGYGSACIMLGLWEVMYLCIKGKEVLYQAGNVSGHVFVCQGYGSACIKLGV